MRIQATVLMVFVAVVVLATPASAGQTPSPKSPYNAVASDAVAGATNGSNAYVVMVVSSQRIAISAVSNCSGGCQQLQDGWANTTNPFVPGHPLNGEGITSLYSSFWINTTQNCGSVPCPLGFLQCDQTFYGFGSAVSTRIERPCYDSGVIWSRGTAGQLSINGTLPIYNVTRLQIYRTVLQSQWIVNGQKAILTETVYGPGIGIYGLPNFFTYWAIPSLAWVIPLPAWTWSIPQTTLVWANQSLPVPPQNYTVGATAAVIQWTAYPTVFCASCGQGGVSAGHPVGQTYVFTLVSSAGSPTIVGQNASLGPTLPGAPPASIVLSLGNLSGPSGQVDASVTWENQYSLPFQGAVVLEAPFLANATGIEVSVDGSVLSGSRVLASSTTLTLLPGSVVVGSLNTTQISAVFTIATPPSPASPLLFLNGAGVNAPAVAGLFFLITGTVAYFSRRATADDLISLGVFGAAVVAVIAL